MTNQSYLMHYGIAGQKWGIRRFQNEDGSLTPEGIRRYGIGDNGYISRYGISQIRKAYHEDKRNNDTYRKILREEKLNGKDIGNRRKELEKQYLNEGYTQEQAEIAAYKKARVEKTLKIVGGIAVTAALTYGVIKGRQFLKKYSDTVIRKGQNIQRITQSPTEDMGRAVYISPDKKDFVKYRGLYGSQISDTNQGIAKFKNAISKALGLKEKAQAENNVFQITGQAKSNVKIAGERTGKKVFNSLMKNDPDFKKDFNNDVKNLFTFDAFNGKQTDYEAFNRALGTHGSEGLTRAREKFYNVLKSKGYGGVIDVNDRRFSGYEAKNPTILFNFGKNIQNLDLKKLSEASIASDAKIGRNYIIRNHIMKEKFANISKTTMIYGSGITGLLFYGAKKSENQSRRNDSYYKTVIREYKRVHPNTKLTEREILESLLGA